MALLIPLLFTPSGLLGKMKGGVHADGTHLLQTNVKKFMYTYLRGLGVQGYKVILTLLKQDLKDSDLLSIKKIP